MLKYEDVRCIGRGSYGSAHLVVERATNQRYVIKKIPMELLNDTEKQQSFREVELLAKLKHPNVVEYKESFVESNVIHIVMAYCDGGDLAGRIKERAAILANGGHGYFDTRQILDWFVQMAMAIKYLHEQRILHRDLKTSNIFLTTQNVIKLGDFGIAKTLDSTLDQAKTVVGTPYYMSPEVCESKPYSYASDVWSLGCVLYEIVALKHAFEAPNILTLILKIVQNDFAAVPAHYDPEISDILKRLLDKRPEQRPTMDQIFLMPYVRNHMQALMESGGSLRMSTVRSHASTPKRRVHTKNGRRTTADTGTPAKARRSGSSTTTSSTCTSTTGTDGSTTKPSTRWAAIAPNDREEVCLGDGSDLELLDASSSALVDSHLDLRLPERSKTPDPLVPPPPPPPPPVAVRPSPRRRKPSHCDSDTGSRSSRGPVVAVRRRLSESEIEEELDTRFQAEAAEALMNPNFQRVYAEECDDSLTFKYAPQSKPRVRHQPTSHKPYTNGKPPKPLTFPPPPPPPPPPSAYGSRRQVGVCDLHHLPAAAAAAAPQHSWGVAPRRTREHAAVAVPLTLTLSLSLDESTLDDDSDHQHYMDASGAEPMVNLSDSGMLRQLELEEASSGDDNYDDDAYTSNSDEYDDDDGDANFYSEHDAEEEEDRPAYSDDSDFAGDEHENEAEYSDDFEELDGEVIEYANDEFAAENDDDGGHASHALQASSTRAVGNKSPKFASSPASQRAPREVQWVMRNVAQSLMESCDNLSVA